MNLDPGKLQRLCEIAKRAAKKSGAMIQSYVGREIMVSNKLAGSSAAAGIVTEVDFKSQDMILSFIEPTLREFDLGILIEESDDNLSRFEKDYFWCIDPLDGTLPFSRQEPGYAVSIALVSREGVPVIGVIYDPLTETLYHAVKNAGAFRNEQSWEMSAKFHGRFKTVQAGGAVMNACRVLEEAPACFVKNPKTEQGGGALWDYAATTCLFKETGCFVRDRGGGFLDLNSPDSLYMNRKGVVFASHDEIFDLL